MKNWTNKDWVWVTSILIGIIIIILTWRLNDNDNVVNIISMFASGASIILAVVAIVQSTIYNSSSNELNARMTEKLSTLESNIELVKNNILSNANEVIDNAPIKEEIKENIKLSLKTAVNDEYFERNRGTSAYIFEKLISYNLKYAYSESYKIKNNVRIDKNEIDIILENDSKIIFIELKVLSQPRIDILVRAINNINKVKREIENPNKKELIPILIILSDKFDYPEPIKCNDIKMVWFTQNELLNITTDKFKQKINI